MQFLFCIFNVIYFLVHIFILALVPLMKGINICQSFNKIDILFAFCSFIPLYMKNRKIILKKSFSRVCVV